MPYHTTQNMDLKFSTFTKSQKKNKNTYKTQKSINSKKIIGGDSKKHNKNKNTTKSQKKKMDRQIKY